MILLTLNSFQPMTDWATKFVSGVHQRIAVVGSTIWVISNPATDKTAPSIMTAHLNKQFSLDYWMESLVGRDERVRRFREWDFPGYLVEVNLIISYLLRTHEDRNLGSKELNQGLIALGYEIPKGWKYQKNYVTTGLQFGCEDDTASWTDFEHWLVAFLDENKVSLNDHWFEDVLEEQRNS